MKVESLKGESLYDESWVRLVRYHKQIEAAMAVERLKAAGIPCYMLGDHIPGNPGMYVYVKAYDLEDAKDLLSEESEAE